MTTFVCRARPCAARRCRPSAAACSRKERRRAAGRDAERHAQPRSRAARQSRRHHLQVRRRRRRDVRRGLSRDGPRRRRRRRADVDRRSQSADADDAVEAGADGRVHADGVRADVSVRRRGDDPDRAVLDDEPEARCRWRATTSGSAPTRSRQLQLQPQTENVFVGVQGRLAPGGGRRAQRRRVEWQWTKKEATLVVQEPEEGRVLLPRRRQSGERLQRAAAGEGHARRPDARRVHARSRSSRDAAEDSR